MNPEWDDNGRFPVASLIPALTLGLAGWKTCGRHCFICLPGVRSCPIGLKTCGRRLRRANEKEVARAMKRQADADRVAAEDADVLKPCRRCGSTRPIRKFKQLCDECSESGPYSSLYNRTANGSKKQETWDGKRHTCCGTTAFWRHRSGCRRPDGNLPPDK